MDYDVEFGTITVNAEPCRRGGDKGCLYVVEFNSGWVPDRNLRPLHGDRVDGDGPAPVCRRIDEISARAVRPLCVPPLIRLRR
jgi:hypothetical protein